MDILIQGLDLENSLTFVDYCEARAVGDQAVIDFLNERAASLLTEADVSDDHQTRMVRVDQAVELVAGAIELTRTLH